MSQHRKARCPLRTSNAAQPTTKTTKPRERCALAQAAQGCAKLSRAESLWHVRRTARGIRVLHQGCFEKEKCESELVRRTLEDPASVYGSV